MKLIKIGANLLGMVCFAIVSGCAGTNEAADTSIADLTSLSMSIAYQYSQEVTDHLARHGDEETIGVAKTVVADTMEYPATAQFHSVRLVPYGAGQVVCGYINGKKNAGAYYGFRSFIAGTEGATISTTSGEYERVIRAQNAGIVDACG